MAEEEATFAVKHFVAASVILYFCETVTVSLPPGDLK